MTEYDAEPKELREYAKELFNYADKMPHDPYARRWTLTGFALIRWADILEQDKNVSE